MKVRAASITPISVEPNLTTAPTGWRWARLTELARLESGHTPSRVRPDWWGGRHLLLSLTEIRAFDGEWVTTTQIRTNSDGIANSAARILPRGTVCLSRTASVGFVTIMATPMATSQDFANWVCGKLLDPEFLMYALIRSRDYLRDLASGATHKTIYMPTLEAFQICIPELEMHKAIAKRLKHALMESYRAASAASRQVEEVSALSDAIVLDSISKVATDRRRLGSVRDEVKHGIGAGWACHPVLGATRDGLAPANEKPGKQASKYKPATPGTVFYNPMRILIGSIAYVDDDDTPGITSPDYVVLRGKPDHVDSRWFYYWLRSPLGAQCILSLARGAVRERMLYNRLAEGEITLPSFADQQRASRTLRELKPVKKAFESRLSQIDLLPKTILAQAFEM
jgi:type I restriction enzyme, S subunit